MKVHRASPSVYTWILCKRVKIAVLKVYLNFVQDVVCPLSVLCAQHMHGEVLGVVV